MNTNDIRFMATQYAWRFIGTWYKWGGSNPGGFDCSGFACELLQAVGKIPRSSDLTAQALFDRFKDRQVEAPYEGCLVFYSNPNHPGFIIHVEYCLDSEHSIGASGGGSTTITVLDAMANNAFIKIRPINSRAGIAGYVDPFKEI